MAQLLSNSVSCAHGARIFQEANDVSDELSTSRQAPLGWGLSAFIRLLWIQHILMFDGSVMEPQSS
jgi:hypothetical protein